MKYTAGTNIAMKIPPDRYDATVAFYRDQLGFSVVEELLDHPAVSKTHRVVFGQMTLWLDCVDAATVSEIWLEVMAENADEVAAVLEQNGVQIVDHLEQLPPNKHWIKDPAGSVLLVSERKQ